MIHMIDPVTRISISRSGNQSAALLQIRETNGWETRVTNLYDAGLKGDVLVSDMKKQHQDYLKRVEYQRGLMEPYH
jgi:hypothetical protein